MEVITIDSHAYTALIDKIENLENRFADIVVKASNPFQDRWLDIEEACFYLKVSKRTLQSYRDTHRIPFSCIGKKIYYKASDLEKMLNKGYQGIIGF
jgi:excisionase family DNA binding protein